MTQLDPGQAQTTSHGSKLETVPRVTVTDWHGPGTTESKSLPSPAGLSLRLAPAGAGPESQAATGLYSASLCHRDGLEVTQVQA